MISSRPSRPHRCASMPSASQRQLDDAAVVVEALEEDVAPARERELDDSEPDSLDVAVRVEEPAPEVLAERLQRVAAELERGDVDEVLHRVGRDDHRVVAGRVRRREVVAEDVDLDLRAPQLPDAVAPVDAHLGLAVVDPHPRLLSWGNPGFPDPLLPDRRVGRASSDRVRWRRAPRAPSRAPPRGSAGAGAQHLEDLPLRPPVDEDDEAEAVTRLVLAVQPRELGQHVGIVVRSLLGGRASREARGADGGMRVEGLELLGLAQCRGSPRGARVSGSSSSASRRTSAVSPSKSSASSADAQLPR